MQNQILRAPLRAFETHVPNMVAVGAVRKKPFNYKVGRSRPELSLIYIQARPAHRAYRSITFQSCVAVASLGRPRMLPHGYVRLRYEAGISHVFHSAPEHD